MPFACLGRGLTAAYPEPGWASVFMDVLALWRKQALCDGIMPEFLLPAMRDGCLRLIDEPAEYWHVAKALRFLLAESGVPDPLAFSVHSLKVTMLAWTGQVASVERDYRKNQGHHKLDVAWHLGW